MQLPLILTTYAYDRQQVIYIFDKMMSKLIHKGCQNCNTRRLPPIKKVID